ncbi:MAG: branched-chain amino acid ABC transporter permease [Bacillota bacterium]|jgi:branched-chain amino acid transport system permease protein
MQLILEVAMNGLLMGAIYALVAIGVALVWGVMNVINFAHGDFLMLGMYCAYWLFVSLRLDPVISAPICGIVMFFLGLAVYHGLVKRVLKAPPMSQIFATFGLAIFIKYLAFFLWKPDFRMVTSELVEGSISVFGANVGVAEIAAGLGSLLATAALFVFVKRTKAGLALQATAIDREGALLMGINSERVYALAFGIGSACAGMAGGFLASFQYIFPAVGETWNTIAFATVALGGFGSVDGALYAGLVMGLAGALGGYLIGPAYKLAIIFSIFFLILLIRPKGLAGW